MMHLKLGFLCECWLCTVDCSVLRVSPGFPLIDTHPPHIPLGIRFHLFGLPNHMSKCSTFEICTVPTCKKLRKDLAVKLELKCQVSSFCVRILI